MQEIRDLLFDLATGTDVKVIAEKMQSLGLNVQQDAVDAVEQRKIVHFEVSEDQFIQGYDLLKSQLMRQGVDVENHAFFSQLDNDPAQKVQVLNELKAMVDQAAMEQYETDLQSGAIVELDFEPRQISEKGIQRMAIKMGLESAKSQLIADGVDINEHPFFQKLNADPEGEEKFITEMELMLSKKAMK